jgi:hypothetical protein
MSFKALAGVERCIFSQKQNFRNLNEHAYQLSNLKRTDTIEIRNQTQKEAKKAINVSCTNFV